MVRVLGEKLGRISIYIESDSFERLEREIARYFNKYAEAGYDTSVDFYTDDRLSAIISRRPVNEVN